jgi:outer membrane protein TolC
MTKPTVRRGWLPGALLCAPLCAMLAGPALAAPLELGGDLPGLLAYARDHHPEFAAMRHEAAAAAARADVADSLPDPMFKAELANVTNAGSDAGLNLLPSRVGSTRYTFSQSLPWPGKLGLRKEVAEANLTEAQQKATATWRDLARMLRQTYARHHVVHASLGFASHNLDLLTQLEQIARTRYANGIAAQQDVIRAQTERSMLLTEIAALEGENEQLQARTRALLGNPPDLKLLPPLALNVWATAAKVEPKALAEALRAANPWVVAEEARVLAAERGKELAYRNRYPDFNLGVTPMQTRNRVEGWDLMLELNIPLQFARRRSEEREAERMLDAARSRREAALNQAQSELAESLAMLNSARRMDELVKTRLLPQAELTLQAALAAYENGKVDFATVLDAQRQVRKSKEEGVKARAEQLMRLADIERLTGVEL